MLSNSFKALGGWSSVVSGLLLFIAHFINLFGDSDEGTLYGSSFVLAAHVIAIFALFAIYAFLAKDSKGIGLVGLVLSVLGTTFVSGIVFVEIAGFSGINTDLVFQAPVSGIIYTVGPLLFVIGMLLIGISIVKTGLKGMFLILGTLVFVLASFVGDSKLWIEAIGAAITGLGFILCGLPMLESKNENKTTGVSL